MIDEARIRTLNREPVRPGAYVLSWMQQAQRANWNHALEHAIRQANDLRLPVLALVALTAKFPEANERHYRFMLEGLRETARRLARRGIRLCVRLQHPPDAVLALAREAALVVTDAGYLRIQKLWRAEAARRIPCRMQQVETDVVVPVEEASGKEEYMAATLRPRIGRALERFLVPLAPTRPAVPSLDLVPGGGEDPSDVDGLLRALRLGRGAPPAAAARGGASEAERRLKAFLRDKLEFYGGGRNDPAGDDTSGLSPYLHFGQISPLQVALAVRDASRAAPASGNAFLEQLIVRRELSMNFVAHNARYDSYACLPEWARGTLERHAHDPREAVYARDVWEAAATHDPIWNAAQKELAATGRMHGYLRMYWGKKILEWSASPAEGFETALYLNDKYELDGRDPNGFAGVAWCFGKHDRPWPERPVFGTVRCMTASGLRKKCDIDAYLRKIAALAG